MVNILSIIEFLNLHKRAGVGLCSNEGPYEVFTAVCVRLSVRQEVLIAGARCIMQHSQLSVRFTRHPVYRARQSRQYGQSLESLFAKNTSLLNEYTVYLVQEKKSMVGQMGRRQSRRSSSITGAVGK